MNPFIIALYTKLNSTFPYIDSMSSNDGVVNVQYKSGTTQAQKDAVDAAIASFVMPTTKVLSDVITQIQNLSTTDKAKLQAGVFAQFVIEHPAFAANLNITI